MTDENTEKHIPSTAAALELMAERLRECAKDCEAAAAFLVEHQMDSFPKVGMSTSQLLVQRMQSFVRRLNMHKQKHQDIIRESATKFEVSRRRKKKD